MRYKKYSFSFCLYTFSLFLLMCTLGELSFTWHIPKPIPYILATVCSLSMLSRVKFSGDNLKLAMIYAIFILYQVFFCRITVNVISVLFSILPIIIISTLLLSSLELKKDVFSLLSTMFSIIIGVSIVGWILYLIGVTIPVGELYESDDQFHVLRNYYFFVRSERTIDAMLTSIPRFCGMFLEPGQLAVPCAFFLFGSTTGIKDVRNIIFLTACILSFSLSGYSLLLTGYVLMHLLPKIKRSFSRTLIISSLLFFSLFNVTQLSSEQDSDNPFYTFILSRLEPNENKIISGNNRTSSFFDIEYEKFIQTDDVYTGLQGKDSKLANWTCNSSGYKKFIVYYGLIGLVLLTLFCIQLYKQNKCERTLPFLLIAILAFLPRAMLHTFMWLIPFILSMFLLKQNDKDRELKLAK